MPRARRKLMLALLILLAGAPGASNDLEKPPLTMPLFDGAQRTIQPRQSH